VDSLLNRYRNITALLLVIFAQLILLAYQVKSNQDVRLIRVWAVTGVTPLARLIEGLRSRAARLLEDYVLLHGSVEENRRLKAELGQVKMENQRLKSELETADRVRALSLFQTRTPSRTIVARIIGTGTGANSRVVFVDRGSASGVMKGMAVVTPDGIVGKVIAAYPIAAQVLLVTDPTFAAGVISQKHRVHGILKGLGYSSCLVDYVQNEEPVETGEWFYTSGDDGVFPKGFPVGTVTVSRPGNPTKQIYLLPSGLQRGLEEVLIILEGIHQPIPEPQAASAEVQLLPPPPDQSQPAGGQAEAGAGAPGTEADRLRERYKQLGAAQNHKFGEGLPGSKPPDFNLPPGQAAAPQARPPGAGSEGAPSAPKPQPPSNP
jgi:rod shape-determining protein MreC